MATSLSSRPQRVNASPETISPCCGLIPDRRGPNRAGDAIRRPAAGISRRRAQFIAQRDGRKRGRTEKTCWRTAQKAGVPKKSLAYLKNRRRTPPCVRQRCRTQRVCKMTVGATRLARSVQRTSPAARNHQSAESIDKWRNCFNNGVRRSAAGVPDLTLAYDDRTRRTRFQDRRTAIAAGVRDLAESSAAPRSRRRLALRISSGRRLAAYGTMRAIGCVTVDHGECCAVAHGSKVFTQAGRELRYADIIHGQSFVWRSSALFQ